MVLKATLTQKAMMLRYGIQIHEDAYDTLLAISDTIFDIGFLPGKDYNLLNPTGLKLQKLYDELYEQNRYGDLE